MSEQGDNSWAPTAETENPTANESPPAAKSMLEKLKDWVDVLFKLVGVLIAIGGAWWASDFKDKISAASLLAQREQAETNLRATMFNNLMERIVSKAEDIREAKPERMLLLAKMLALNFDEHFEFKPLLVDLYKKLNTDPKNPQKAELESVARRIVDRQIDTLRAVALTQKVQDIFTSDLFFKRSNESHDLPVSYGCNYIDRDSFWSLKLDKSLFSKEDEKAKKLELKQQLAKVWVNTQQQPAFFTNGDFSNEGGLAQCIDVYTSGYKLEIAVLKANFKEKTVAISVNVTGTKLRSINMVYEFELTPFDFPLTDNTTIDSDHRFSIVIKSIDENDGVWLRLIWFPEAYITERERPINYSEIRKALGAQKKEKNWYNPNTW